MYMYKYISHTPLGTFLSACRYLTHSYVLATYTVRSMSVYLTGKKIVVGKKCIRSDDWLIQRGKKVRKMIIYLHYQKKL